MDYNYIVSIKDKVPKEIYISYLEKVIKILVKERASPIGKNKARVLK